jgi:hypothetical protein
MNQSDTRALGLMIFGISLMATFYVLGMFYKHYLVSEVLLSMYLFGLSTTIGLLLVELGAKKRNAKKKKKRKYVQKKKTA